MSIRGGDSHRKTASIKKRMPGCLSATDCIEGLWLTFSLTGYAIDCFAGLGHEKFAALAANATCAGGLPPS
jgi:hypothetical protein